MITRSDKGNSTVILDKIEYKNKVIEMLNDTSIYEQVIFKNYNNILEKSNNDLINKWQKKNYTLIPIQETI